MIANALVVSKGDGLNICQIGGGKEEVRPLSDLLSLSSLDEDDVDSESLSDGGPGGFGDSEDCCGVLGALGLSGSLELRDFFVFGVAGD